MAARAARAIVRSDGFFCKAFSSNTSSAEGPTLLLTKDEHRHAIQDFIFKQEKSITEFINKYDKEIAEVSDSANKSILLLQLELNKDLDDKQLKHYINQVSLRNELKILEKRLESHKIGTSVTINQGVTVKGWALGAAAALITWVINIPKYLNNGKE